MEGSAGPYAEFIGQITSERFSVAGYPLPTRLSDPLMNPFLEAALAGKADCLITGNVKHFPLGRRQGIVVLRHENFSIATASDRGKAKT
jgi:predicted nucleic acid-binding protein